MTGLPPIQHKLTELLAMRDHSQHELMRKLLQKGYALDDIKMVLADFTERGWLDDADFASQLLQQALRKGNGPMKVKQQLMQKGVSSEDIQRVFADVDEAQWVEIAETVWQKKFRGNAPSDVKEMAKQMRFLAQRGFDQSQIRQAVPEIVKI